MNEPKHRGSGFRPGAHKNEVVDMEGAKLGMPNTKAAAVAAPVVAEAPAEKTKPVADAKVEDAKAGE